MNGLALGVLTTVGMDAVFFSMKRAHLGGERLGRALLTVHVDALITDHVDTDPATVRHTWSDTFFSMGARLGNRVRRNTDLYCWDIEEFYAWLTTPEERGCHRGVPFVDELET